MCSPITDGAAAVILASEEQARSITDKPVWFIVYHLFDIKHYELLTPAMKKQLHRVDERLFQAECLGKALKDSE